jgi:DNA-binding NtrC family response regulator
MAIRKILLVDDDAKLRRMLNICFSGADFLVEEAATCAAAEESFRTVRPDLSVIDFRLPDGTALELLPKLKEIEPSVPIIVLTGFGSMELGVALIKAGAEQCLAKPIEPPELLLVVKKVLENTRNQQKQIATKSQKRRTALDPFLGESAKIKTLAEKAIRVAHSTSPVLIQGETGSGKGVLANWLHENSDRSDEALVDLNCAGLSREFLETELFGYEKGAYTGAANPKPGLLEVAHRGTVFLDEIGDVDPLVQPKLLKVVEEKRFRRLGDVRDRFVDVRLIAATHHDLLQLIDENKFRRDLYFRISTVPIVIPPLRERQEDIPIIANEVLGRICHDMGRSMMEISPSAANALAKYTWPGNIREMRNVLERAVLLTEGRELTAADFQFESEVRTAVSNRYDPKATLADIEDTHIRIAMEEEAGNVEKAAKRLGIPKSTLYQRLRVIKAGASS